MYTVVQDILVIRAFWGEKARDTVVFDTVIVAQIHQTLHAELTDIGWVFQM
jgi:hypothetical protein